MYTLNTNETKSVSGGVVEELFGVAELDAGITLAAAGGAVVAAAGAGWWIGTQINKALEHYGY